MPPDYTINDPSALLSPSLVIFRDVVESNVDAMIRIAGSADRLRPHVKTHKMPAMVRLLEAKGIHKHKCATIAEAEMVAAAGGRDALLSYPLVGPNLPRFAALIDTYPETTFRATVDDPDAACSLSEAMGTSPRKVLPVLVDINIGMGRTGIDPERADDLANLIDELPGLEFDGIHAYDGQVRDTDLAARARTVQPGTDATLALRDRLQANGLAVHRLVMGGTPSFSVHAGLDQPGVECSPGTCTLHDVGYKLLCPDLPFEPAALLLTRVISHPGPDRLCLDLGYKAVASDPAMAARLTLVELPEAPVVVHSEEHVVVQTPRAGDYLVGRAMLAIPGHICPTSALHRQAYVVAGGELVDLWEITARDRVISV